MASDFKNAITAGVEDVFEPCYTTPIGCTTTVIGLSVANVGFDFTNVDVVLHDISKSSSAHIGKELIVYPQGTLIVVGGDQKIVLEEGDYISVKTSSGGSVDVILSVLEVS